MAKLLYSALGSLDGYIADAAGNFGWAAPSEQVHRFVNELERPVGTYLYGRRMYEIMSFWETAPTEAGQPDYFDDFTRLWLAADKIVYSTTLAQTTTAKTRLERRFDPSEVAKLKRDSPHDLGVGGPQLAAQALRAGLVDELWLILVPVIVGGGARALPDGVRLNLELLREQRFDNGTVALHYRLGAAD